MLQPPQWLQNSRIERMTPSKHFIIDVIIHPTWALYYFTDSGDGNMPSVLSVNNGLLAHCIALGSCGLVLVGERRPAVAFLVM